MALAAVLRRMRALKRRAVALAAVLAVAWAALWPLVSSVEGSIAGEPVPLCHEAGSEVAVDEMPAAPTPGEHGKAHCPLCIVAFYLAFAAPLPQPAFAFAAMIATGDRHGAVLLSRFESPLPPSRAPPLA